MSKSFKIQPWKETCELRKEIRERSLTPSDFAIDLHKVTFGVPGEKPYYCDPVQFFSTTYATQNLRQFCKVVLKRLAKLPGGEPIINVSQTFGGGKSHTLTTLYYLTNLGEQLPVKETSVKMILNDAKINDPPEAQVAAVSFDKVDWKAGGDVKSPDGETRRFRMPWNLIAWQLLGQRGIDILKRDETQPDFDTPPADTLWADILREVESSGRGALILLDEFLMWAHDAGSPDPTGESRERGPFWYDRLKNFFQKLAQAIESSERSCLVVSLLATEPSKIIDDVGQSILNACNSGLGRQASIQSPVEKDDLAELLRRRMFAKYPENETDRHKHCLAFWERMKAAEPIRAKMPDSEERLKKAYPFHPDLLDRFFGKWVDLHQFQRTRGVLQTFALALRDSEPWDTSPLIGAQVFLTDPKQIGLSEALLKLAQAAKDSDPDHKFPPWRENLETELPRALEAQKADAPTLTGREIEAACVAAFIYSQPVGEQAELGDLRWLLGATCDMPAVLNAGLSAWARISWYLEECDNTEAGTGVPKFWRLGPKPNLNQLHDSYKRQALKHSKAKFDELAKTKCTALYADIEQYRVKTHKLPLQPGDVDDDGQFRLVVLGSDYAGVIGDPPNPKAVEFIRTHSSPTDQRTYQNIILVATPSVTGLHQAEQQIADWMAWGEIKNSGKFAELDAFQQETVKKRERETLGEAQGAVKNAYEIVLYLNTDGTVLSRKITIGAQSLMAALLLERDLRLFNEKMDATAIMPGAHYDIWPPKQACMPVKDLYQAFGQQAKLPKLLNRQVVVNTVEDAVRRGVLALHCKRPDGSEKWYWRSPIDMADWDLMGEAVLPQEAELTSLSPSALLPDALPGLWPTDDLGVLLSEVFGWFDGGHFFEEQTIPDYPPEPRPVPKVDYKIVQMAVSAAIAEGALWLIYGNDSVYRDKPTAIQLDPDAVLYRPPLPLAGIDFLPGALPEAWTREEEPKTTIEKLYAEIKAVRGKPWPEKLFLDGLTSAIAQGFIHQSAPGSIGSLQHDGKRKLIIKSVAPPPPPSPPPTDGRRKTNMVTLNVSDVQTLSDEIHQITKLLAGSDPVIEACISIKPKEGIDLKAVEKILKKIKGDWKF
ncbi:MAG: ATP-binding protein [Deltaproteobacteria bacterium]|nr:ATP-binding protein [Deltaproteobacteria bacterium]